MPHEEKKGSLAWLLAPSIMVRIWYSYVYMVKALMMSKPYFVLPSFEMMLISVSSSQKNVFFLKNKTNEMKPYQKVI